MVPIESKPHSGANVALIRESLISMQNMPEALHEFDSLVEQLEAADRVLAVADQLAEWCRVATSVNGVFSNNLGAQAQGQGMANLVVRYVATRESYPAKRPT